MTGQHHKAVQTNTASVAAATPSVRPTMIVRLFSMVIVAILVLAPAVVGGALFEIPPRFPQGFWGWFVYVCGAILLVIESLVVPDIPRVYDKIQNRTVDALYGGSASASSPVPPKLVSRKKRWLVSGVAFAVLAGFAVVVQLPLAAASPLPAGDLQILSGKDKSFDARQMLIEQWNQTHPHNHVTATTVEGSPDQQHERMVNDVRPGGPHTAAVYVLDVIWMAEFIQNGYIKRLDRSKRVSDDSDFVPAVLRTCEDRSGNERVIWCLPLNTDVGLMYYRKDLSSVGRPPDWAGYFGGPAKDVLARAKSADASDRLVAANAAQLADEEILSITAFEAIWAAGGSMVDNDGHVRTNATGTEVILDEKTRKGIADLAAAQRDPEIVLPGGSTEDKAVEDFANGRSLFMRNWPVAYDRLRQDNGSSVAFDIAPLPNVSALGGQNLAISGAIEDQDPKVQIAHALIEYLASPESQLVLFSVGGFAPTQRIVYEHYVGISRRYISDIEEAVRRANLRPATPRYTEFSRAFRAGVTYAFANNGALPPDFGRELAKYLR